MPAVGPLANPAANVDDMTNRAIADGKTTYVVERYRRGVSPVFAVLALIVTMIMCIGFSPIALADDATGSDPETTTTDTSGTTSTVTDDITDVSNLLGSDLTKVSDAIATTKQETGVSVRLMYLPTFGSKNNPQQWASKVLEDIHPDPNTVMLAVASDDGNLVVAVSSNSDEWLKKQQTVDDLSKVATDPLLKDTPDWAGSATAMMDEIVKLKKTSTSSSSVMIGVIVFAVVLVVLIAVIVATVLIRRRIKRKVLRMAAERKRKPSSSATDDDAHGAAGDDMAGDAHGDERPLTRKEIRMRRKAGMWKNE